MTRSFMLAVSGLALLNAACSPDEDEIVVAETEAGETVLAEDEDRDAVPEGAQPMDALREDLQEDDNPPLNEEAVEDALMENGTADTMPDGEIANFGMDYAGLWGSEAQCANGQAWAFSASSISTPEGEVCSVTNLEQGAGQVMITGECMAADGSSSGERTFTLALQDDQSLNIVDTTEVNVQRCTSFEAPETEDTEGETDDETPQ